MEYVPSAEFHRKIGLYQDKALIEPITVMRNGRARVVLLSVEEYQRLKRLDREVLSVGELSEQELEAITAAEMPAGHEVLNQELSN